MIEYGYICPECKQEYTSPVRVQKLDSECRSCKYPGPLNRKYTLAIHNGMKPHVNKTTQTEIRSEKQFARELKQRGEELEDRTGMPHRFVPVDPDETRKRVEDSEGIGLEATNQRRVAAGQPAIRLSGKKTTVV